LLSEEKRVGTGTWTDAQLAIIRGYGLITGKPELFVANIGEDAIGGNCPAAEIVEAAAAASGGVAVRVCAKLESELAELDDADRDEMLESLGLDEPAIGPLARAANELLGLTTFFTAGEKEVRAWTIRLDATAPQAAGVIHSDLERGFIRAECYHVDDLSLHKSEKAIKEAGRMRSEGKGYVMHDGDVVHFLFNV
jgi:ribosome-binding ATPase YchF (GTP1/OBG family)